MRFRKMRCRIVQGLRLEMTERTPMTKRDQIAEKGKLRAANITVERGDESVGRNNREESYASS